MGHRDVNLLGLSELLAHAAIPEHVMEVVGRRRFMASFQATTSVPSGL
jgi:hypothetical protein